MVKTRLIVNTDPNAFEQRLNDFIKDKSIIDIKYEPSVISLLGCLSETESGLRSSSMILDRALVIYTEEE